MKLALYSSLSKGQKDIQGVRWGDAFPKSTHILEHGAKFNFAPDDKVVRFYCCGPTVYGPAHIGNFRTFIIQDVIRRVLEYLSFKVVHVRNLTDVDDKTIAGAESCGVSLKEYTDKWRDRFLHDAKALGCLEPHFEPSAVAYINGGIIQLIEGLLREGFAYQLSDGSVYLEASKAQEVTLSSFPVRKDGQSRLDDEVFIGRKGEGDFVLWKAWVEKDGKNFWESSFGKGRPGWHSECSAMALDILGSGIELHGGGEDLLFPHHQNETLQAEVLTKELFVKHWVHSSHLLVDGRKMSKSLGNLYTLSDLEERGYSPECVRYALLQAHYRKPLNFTFDLLHQAEKALERLRHQAEKEGSNLVDISPNLLSFLLDDLNVAEFLGEVFSRIGATNNEVVGVRKILEILGLNIELQKNVVPDDILALAAKRLQARKRRDFIEADMIKKELQNLGWRIQRDTAESCEVEREKK